MNGFGAWCWVVFDLGRDEPDRRPHPAGSTGSIETINLGGLYRRRLTDGTDSLSLERR